MEYYRDLKSLRLEYRAKLPSLLKMVLLYPFFKLTYWTYYGSDFKRALAGGIFRVLPKRVKVNLSLFSKGAGKYLRVPVWLSPDHLTSFREVIWFHAYALQGDWIPDAMVDAGANIGYASLYMGLRYPVKTILAIEANPFLWPLLIDVGKSLKEVGVQVFIAEGALTGTEGTVFLNVQENSRNSSTDSRGGQLRVEGHRLANWMGQLKVPASEFQTRALFKLDIEGGEYELFENDPSIFDHFDYLISEFHGPLERRYPLIQKVAGHFKTVLKQESPPTDCEVCHFFEA